MEDSQQITIKLKQVLHVYIDCLELYCRYSKSTSKNPAIVLTMTKKLIDINQRIQQLAKDITKDKAGNK